MISPEIIVQNDTSKLASIGNCISDRLSLNNTNISPSAIPEEIIYGRSPVSFASRGQKSNAPGDLKRVLLRATYAAEEYRVWWMCDFNLVRFTIPAHRSSSEVSVIRPCHPSQQFPHRITVDSNGWVIIGMENYELGAEIDRNDRLGLKVFEAHNKKNGTKVIVKEYSTCDIQQLDCILKNAFRQSCLLVPEDGELHSVILTGNIHQTLKVSWIVEPPSNTVESFLVSRDETYPPLPPGLTGITLGQKLAVNRGTKMAVHEGVIAASNEPVIVKRYRTANLKSLNCVIKEAIMQARAKHRHITRLIDVAISKAVGESGVEIALIMERLERDLLKDIANRPNPYTEDELAKCFMEVSAALLHAKNRVKLTQGLAHRDLKPENIFISGDGDYKVGDFGESAAIEEGTFQEDGHGTPEYMSLETKILCLKGLEVEPYKADVYSLGVTMLHMALGYYPKELCTLDKDALMVAVEENINKLSYSKRVKSLLRSMLSVDVELRPYLEGVRAALVAPSEPNEELGYRLYGVDSAHAESHYLEKIERLKRQGMAETRVSAVYYSHLALVYLSQGRQQEAEEATVKSISIQLRHYEDKQHDLAATYTNLSIIHEARGRLPEAEEAASKAIEILRKHYGDGHLSVATSYSSLSQIYQSQGRLQEAEQIAIKCINIWIQLCGDKHYSVAAIYNNLSVIYIDQGRLQEAERAAVKSLEINSENYRDNYRELATSYCNLSVICRGQGRLQEAKEFASKSIDIWIEKYGDKYHSVAASYNSLALVYRDQGQLQEAEEAASKAIDVLRKNYGDRHHFVAATYNILFRIYIDQGRLQEAEQTAINSNNIQIQVYGNGHHSVARTYIDLSMIYQAQGRLQEAEQAVMKSIDIWTQNYETTIT